MKNLPPSFVFLREATDDDIALCMAWRSNPLVYAGFFSQKKHLTWEEHDKWWHNRNKDWRQFIIMVLDEEAVQRPVGVITIGQLDYWECEYGVYIGEVSSWGKGYGSRAIQLALDWVNIYRETHSSIVAVRTTILDKNITSIKLFLKLGWKRIAPARKNESLYRKWL